LKGQYAEGKMPRRARAAKRAITPDARYHSPDLAKFINKMMLDGKKSKAERMVYDALDIIERETKKNPLDVFEQALRNATPVVEVKPRRVGGATYQVPVDIRADRRVALAMRWLRYSARGRKGKPMAERLAAELLDASRQQGATIKKREDTHRMAEANKAFVHYRW
jgi:small subunit ribosomal protein S7